EETEAFLRSALARAEEKIEEDEREIEHLRAQIEKLRRMLFGTRSEKLRREVEQAEALNRPGFPGECFICELRLPDHRFRWKHNKLFLLLPEGCGP
ncbi:transposase domain-containing protein, partial [Shigella flexneri]